MSLPTPPPIKPGRPPLGITFWAQWYSHLVPRFEVFKYAGWQQAIGHYIFQSRKNGCYVSRGFYQLNANGFVPFLLNMEAINKYMEERP